MREKPSFLSGHGTSGPTDNASDAAHFEPMADSPNKSLQPTPSSDRLRGYRKLQRLSRS